MKSVGSFCVPRAGLEPARTKYTRPSTAPVYQFQHLGW